MDFKTAARLGNCLAKDYAESFFELLVNYRDISASEAASRLGLHINTTQDYLETLAELGIVDKREVYERKRPYYRFSLVTDRIVVDLDLTAVKRNQAADVSDRLIREAPDANARFVTSRSGQSLSKVALWSGRGRDRKERIINLTDAQGRFLYYLPFPDGEPLSMSEIMRRADIAESLSAEIDDIVELLIEHGVIAVC